MKVIPFRWLINGIRPFSRSQDSAVGIATGHGLEDGRVRI
jgi:hypothetical protein